MVWRDVFSLSKRPAQGYIPISGNVGGCSLAQSIHASCHLVPGTMCRGHGYLCHDGLLHRSGPASRDDWTGTARPISSHGHLHPLPSSSHGPIHQPVGCSDAPSIFCCCQQGWCRVNACAGKFLCMLLSSTCLLTTISFFGQATYMHGVNISGLFVLCASAFCFFVVITMQFIERGISSSSADDEGGGLAASFQVRTAWMHSNACMQSCTRHQGWVNKVKL